jgi:hypothetical protein
VLLYDRVAMRKQQKDVGCSIGVLVCTWILGGTQKSICQVLEHIALDKQPTKIVLWCWTLCCGARVGEWVSDCSP